MFDSDKPRISNLEGLKNPTILQQLNAMKQYVIDHAIQGPAGPQGEPGKDGTNGTDGAPGAPGTPGVSLVSLRALGDPVQQDGYTVTTVEAVYSDGQTDEFDIRSKNGTDGINGVDGTPGEPGATGPQGPQGRSITRAIVTSYSQQPPYTITNVQLMYGPNPTDIISTVMLYAFNGQDGATGPAGPQGKGIDSITTIGHTTVENETVTTLQVNYTEGDPEQIEVHAENGAGAASLYMHCVGISVQPVASSNYYFNATLTIINTDPTPFTQATIYEWIKKHCASYPYSGRRYPATGSGNMNGTNKILYAISYNPYMNANTIKWYYDNNGMLSSIPGISMEGNLALDFDAVTEL